MNVVSGFLNVEGLIVPVESLTNERAVALARLVASNALPYVQLIECRRQNPVAEFGPIDTVVLDLAVERPQSPVNDIRYVERISIAFEEADTSPPEVQAIRDDFPWVPHLNLRHEEFPRSLCLYDRPWGEMSSRWTPAIFLERIRFWLAATARGELHQEDQPLEPLLLPNGSRIILPGSIYTDSASDAPTKLDVYLASDEPNCQTLIAVPTRNDQTQQGGLKFVAAVFRGQPQTHGLIRRSPRTVEELNSFLASSEIDLLAALRQQMVDFDPDLRKERLILIVVLPLMRNADSDVESHNVWAFATEDDIRSVGEKIGVWDVFEGNVAGRLDGPDLNRTGKSARLELLSPYPEFSPTSAAIANGISSKRPSVVAIGAGALGSQIINTLARTGFGDWTIVDEDDLLPHNLARHVLHGRYVGAPKSVGMAHFINQIYENGARGIVADVLAPEDKAEELNAAFVKAKVILDISASAVVARQLAIDVEGDARRISIFLNPQGTDVVVLAEDKARSTTLDVLEAQYYRFAATDERMVGHLINNYGKLRYGRSCRDVSTVMSTPFVTMLAAHAAQSVRSALDSDQACIHVLRVDPKSGCASSIKVTPADSLLGKFGDWTIVIDEELRSRLHSLRLAKLPNETGGVLIGLYDLNRKRIYVVDTVPSPPDSAEWPTLYIRGAKGLWDEVNRIGEATSGQLEYIGEWHSHPDNCETLPSSDDIKVFAWLTEHLSIAGLPALMAIVGQSAFSSWFLDEIQPSGAWSVGK